MRNTWFGASILILINFFSLVYVCVCTRVCAHVLECVRTHMHVGAHGGQKLALHHLEVDLQVVASSLRRALDPYKSNKWSSLLSYLPSPFLPFEICNTLLIFACSLRSKSTSAALNACPIF